MSDAVRRLLAECHALLADPLFRDKFKYSTAPRMRNAVDAVEAELVKPEPCHEDYSFIGENR